MSISALGSNQQIAYTQFFASQPAGNVTGTQTQPTTGNSGPGNNFFQAISNALSSLGASSTTGTTATAAASNTSSTTTTQSPQQALQAFTQSLLAAIQSQVSGQSGSGTPQAAGGHHHHHGGGGGGVGKLESGIQDILQQLSAASAAGTSTGATASTAATTGITATTGTSGSANGSIASLQTSFNNLLSADGISGTSTTLSSFLQSLQQNLHGSSVSGNVVQTQA